jgi:phosphate uptake regulator
MLMVLIPRTLERIGDNTVAVRQSRG